jgi:hypothetical protein
VGNRLALLALLAAGLLAGCGQRSDEQAGTVAKPPTQAEDQQAKGISDEERQSRAEQPR